MHTTNFRFDSAHREHDPQKMYAWIDKQVSANVPKSIRGLFIDTIIDVADGCTDPQEKNDIRLEAISKVNGRYNMGEVSPAERQQLLIALANLAPVPVENQVTDPSPDDSVRLLLADGREQMRGNVGGLQHRVGRTGKHAAKVVRKF